ncbi:MAG: hypothetical protein ABI305_07395 [Tepidiformaceae bacterium]
MAAKEAPVVNEATDGLIEGRIVHYVIGPGLHMCRPAIVTRVARLRGVDRPTGVADEDGKEILEPTWTLFDTGTCDLTIFTNWNDDTPSIVSEHGNARKTGAVFNADKAPNTWHKTVGCE